MAVETVNDAIFKFKPFQVFQTFLINNIYKNKICVDR